MALAPMDKVKIVVLGDSGVGKTTLTHLMAHNQPIQNPAWTVGCSVEVKLHEYREGYPNQKTVFVELWDVGGSSSHRNTRSIFYTAVNGLILVHDLTNRKSQQNLRKWLAEVVNHEGGGKFHRGSDEMDAETLLGASHLPLLVVGTKEDLSGSRGRGLTFADEVGCDELTLNCRQSSALAAGSSAAVALTRFFDRAMETKRPATEGINPGVFLERRRKLASQCSHAAVCCYKNSHPELAAIWEAQGQPKIVVGSLKSGEEELTSLASKAREQGLVSVIIRDAGRTQVSRGTVTVLGIGPDYSKSIDRLTAKYKLY